MTASTFEPITTAISTNMTPETIVTVLGIGLGASIGLYLVQWGAKKLVRMVRGAFNGRLHA